MLPFNFAPELFTIGTLSIPRYGCLTVAEAIALDSLLESQSELLSTVGDSAEFVAILHLNPLLASLVLISRHDPNWTLEKTVNTFSLEEIGQIADFTLGERRRWKDLSNFPTEDGDGKPTDWAEIFWSLQLHYPNETRFNSEHFSSCPILIIEQAITAATRLELERSHRAAIPISLLGVYSLMSQGLKNIEPAHFNPFERMLNQAEAREEIKPEIAQTLIGLVDSGKVPTWAIAMIPLGKMRLAAKA